MSDLQSPDFVIDRVDRVVEIPYEPDYGHGQQQHREIALSIL